MKTFLLVIAAIQFVSCREIVHHPMYMPSSGAVLELDALQEAEANLNHLKMMQLMMQHKALAAANQDAISPAIADESDAQPPVSPSHNKEEEMRLTNVPTDISQEIDFNVSPRKKRSPQYQQETQNAGPVVAGTINTVFDVIGDQVHNAHQITLTALEQLAKIITA